MPARLEEIRAEAEAAIADVETAAGLEELRVRYTGRRAELTQALRSIGELAPEQRGPVGQAANVVKQALEARLTERAEALEARELERGLVEETVDVTLPGDPPRPAGHLHLVTLTRREMEDIFVGLGFRVIEGPEVEFDYYNFTALNHPPDHPARMLQDTFYISDEVLLRTHTSPMQVRSMEAQEPPIYIVVPGRVYRRDSDATHTPMFHQLEGLAVDEDITLADLRGVLLAFARAMFGPEREVRLRSGYFPFTEPSVEVDVSCFACNAKGWLPDGSRCPLCRGTAWIEILGAGMVDPNVLGFVADNGYDPERVQGFAFGMGIDRIAMLKHGVPDLRMLFENDLRLLEQFGS
ncbi:MAG: phenylalanine--tRNA ligase subunit alpha [Actinomycetota bacterium]|nr:phenylalanine--tRNA ligase subunit alpha [Actinomycetota bacterium]